MHYLILSPGERFDLVIDFSRFAGKNFVVTNNAPAPYGRGGEVVATEVMLLKLSEALIRKRHQRIAG